MITYNISLDTYYGLQAIAQAKDIPVDQVANMLLAEIIREKYPEVITCLRDIRERRTQLANEIAAKTKNNQ